jgi:hypothetical protein
LQSSAPEDEWLIESIKESVTNPALFEKSQSSHMDWFYWHKLVEKLLDGEHFDDEFNLQLTDFIISVTTVQEFGVQLAFDDFAQKILRRLISISPRLIWEKYHETSAASEGKFRLENLFMMGMVISSTPGVCFVKYQKMSISRGCLRTKMNGCRLYWVGFNYFPRQRMNTTGLQILYHLLILTLKSQMR